MIRRIEFYIGILLILVFITGGFYITSDSAVKPIKRDSRDSILQVQRDSALALALNKDLKADSLQAVINRRNLDIKNIEKKYEDIKKNVLMLGPDSTLALFLRTTAH